MFRRSDGSAPVEFVLISIPLLVAFASLLWLIVLGYRQSLLMTAANSIAERAALADVMQPDLADLEADVTADLGIAEAQVQVSRVGSVEFADAQLVDSFGVTLKATGLASVEQ